MKTSIVVLVLGCGAMCVGAAVASRGTGAQPIFDGALRTVHGGEVICAKTFTPSSAMTGCQECFEDGNITIWIPHPPFPPGGHWQEVSAWKRCEEGGPDKYCQTFQSGAFNHCDWVTGNCPNPDDQGSQRYLDSNCSNGTGTYTSCTATFDDTTLTQDLLLDCHNVTNGEVFERP